MQALPYDLLFAFITVAETENLVAAASQLGISQPAVTKKLAKLQERLPHPLFLKQGTRKTLTPYGEALYARLAKRIREFQSTLNEVNVFFSDPKDLTIRIGARREIINSYAPYFVFAGSLHLVPMASERAMALLQERQLDAAIIQHRMNDEEFSCERLAAHGVTFWCHKNLCPKPLGTLITDKSWLQTTPVIAYKSSLPFLEEWFGHRHLPPPAPKVIAEDWFAVARFVEQGQGYGILPSDIRVDATLCHSHPVSFEVVEPLQFFFVVHRSLASVPAIQKLQDRLRLGLVSS